MNDKVGIGMLSSNLIHATSSEGSVGKDKKFMFWSESGGEEGIDAGGVGKEGIRELERYSERFRGVRKDLGGGRGDFVDFCEGMVGEVKMGYLGWGEGGGRREEVGGVSGERRGDSESWFGHR